MPNCNTGFSRDLLLTLGSDSDQVTKEDALSEEEIAFAAGHAWAAAALVPHISILANKVGLFVLETRHTALSWDLSR